MLVFSNVIVIVFALVQGWNLLVVMFGYWLQSVIIGFFNFIKIIGLKEFSTEDFKINGRKFSIKDFSKLLNTPQKTKIYIALFFAFHYGFFHFGYFEFLTGFIKNDRADVNMDKLIYSVLITGTIFFFNHLFSFWYNRKEFKEKKPNISKIMFFPYARIIPMHFIAMSGGLFFVFNSIAGIEFIPLVLFLLFKTLADLIMHIVEHRGFED